MSARDRHCHQNHHVHKVELDSIQPTLSLLPALELRHGWTLELRLRRCVGRRMVVIVAILSIGGGLGLCHSDLLLLLQLLCSRRLGRLLHDDPQRPEPSPDQDEDDQRKDTGDASPTPS